MERNFRHGGDRPGGFRSFAPVKVGDELDVTIESVGEKGDGVAKKNGFVLFVPGTKQNDNVKIRVTKVLRKVGFAEVVGSAGETSEATEESSETTEAAAEENAEEEEQSTDSEDFGEESEQ